MKWPYFFYLATMESIMAFGPPPALVSQSSSKRASIYLVLINPHCVADLNIRLTIEMVPISVCD